MNPSFFPFPELYKQVKKWFYKEYKRYMQSKETTYFIPDWLAGHFIEHYPFMREYKYMILDIARLLNEEFMSNKNNDVSQWRLKKVLGGTQIGNMG